MIVILKPDASEEKRSRLIGWLKEQGVEVHISQGAYQTVLGLIGDASHIDRDLVAGLDIVDSVKTVTEPFKCCSRRSHRSITKSSCHLVPACQRSQSQRGGEGRGPGKGRPLTLVITRAAAKPTRRVLISRHTCEPTQVRNLTTVTGMAVGGNLPAQMN